MMLTGTMLNETMLTEMTLVDLTPWANHLWQSTLCAIAVWLLTLRLKENRASVRYWLWLAASVKFLIPFSLLVGMGSQLAWRTAPAMAASMARPQWSSVVADIGRPFTASAQSLEAATSPASNSLAATVFVVWLCGVAASTVLWLGCWRRIRAARKAATPLALGLPISTMSSAALMEPGVFGVHHPVLLLPEGIIDRLTPAQLHAVLAHEMCHVRRRDNLTAAIHMVVEAVFWFYPPAWWIRARLIEERERACDEAVLQLGNDAEVYAEGILSVCKSYVESPLACVSGIGGADLKKRIVRIMTQRFADQLTLGRKLGLAAFAVAALVLPVGFGLLNAAPSRAQPQAQDTTAAAPVYEVASIKPNRSGDNMVRMMTKPDGFSASGGTVQMLVQDAYGVQDFQIAGAPSWFNSERYDIEAKMDGSVAEELRKLGDDQRRLERDRMLQALLADRFQLKLHRDTKELPEYALVVAKNGSKLHEAKPGDTYANGFKGPDGGGGAGMMFMGGDGGPVTGQAIPIANLVHLLARQLGRTVVDKTGLTGNYDFTLKWAPDESQGPPGMDNGPPPDSSGPSLFTAIQEQLGLRLEAQKGPVEILVIDHVERPSDN
jgi:bla regulator protein BlaR1